MKITTIGKLHQLTWMPRMFPVNSYLVEEEDGLTLVDCGMPFSLRGIVAAAEKLKQPIKRIVLTHAHGDHVGALDGLKRALPELEVMVSARDALLLRGDVTLQPGEPNTPIRGGIPKGIVAQPDRLLQDGDRVGSLLVCAAPGHTPGSIALFDTHSGALVAGDAFQVRGGLAVSGIVRPWFPFPAMATWHRPTALASARRLLELSPNVLAVGHGRMLGHPQEPMRAAIAAAEREWGKRGEKLAAGEAYHA